MILMRNHGGKPSTETLPVNDRGLFVKLIEFDCLNNLLICRYLARLFESAHDGPICDGWFDNLQELLVTIAR